MRRWAQGENHIANRYVTAVTVVMTGSAILSFIVVTFRWMEKRAGICASPVWDYLRNQSNSTGPLIVSYFRAICNTYLIALMFRVG
jgi:hypothetical protein